MMRSSIWLDLPLRRKGLVVVVGPLVAVLIVTPFLLLAERADIRADDRVEHTLVVQAQIQETEVLVFEATARMRGYRLTDDPSFLEAYEASVAALPDAARRLAELNSDNPTQVSRSEQVAGLTTELIAVLEQQRTRGGESIDPSLVLASKDLTDQIVSVLGAMGTEEERLLEEQRDDALAANRRTLIVAAAVVPAGLLLGVVSILLFTIGVARRVRRVADNAARLAAEEPLAPAPPSRDEIGRLAAALEEAGRLLAEGRSALEENERHFRAVVESSTSVIFLKDAEGRFLVLNRAFEDLFHIRSEDAIGKTVHDLFPAQDADAWAANDRDVVAAGVAQQFEETAPTDEGERVFLSTKVPLFDERGEPAGLVGVSTDITERKQSEEALRRWAEIFEHAEWGIVVGGGDAKTLEMVNPAFARMHGYELHELIGRPISDVFAPADRADLAEHIRLTHELGHHRWEAMHVRKDGSEFPVLIDATAVRDELGNVRYRIVNVQDITELRGTQDALTSAKKEADRANQAKSDFLSRMSHELRTPLNAVLGFGQLLEMDERLDADQLETVTQIMRGGRHLLDLINEVLDISRIEAGRLPLSPEPVRIGEALRHAVDLIRPLADARQVAIHLGSEVDGHHVTADRQRLQQVLLNLLSNAVKYIPVGGWVEITCDLVGERCRIHVSDDGPGMAPEDLERAFTPFERLEEAADVEGTGLGLPLSVGLVHAMGGSLTASSTVGQGSSFTVELPLAESPVETYARDEGRRVAEAAEPAGAGRGTVLYVEDNLSNLRLIERILARRPGVRLLSAMQGRLALDLAREHRPDLILLDLHLPDMDGAQVLRDLRLDERTGGIPIVVVSADATPTQSRRVLALGADDYLTKPIDVGRFLEAVDRLLPGDG